MDSVDKNLMQFTSLTFLIFFTVFYLLYLVFQRKLWLQNLWLLLASYAFYSLFGWRFLVILFGMTMLDFSLGWLMGRLDVQGQDSRQMRKVLVGASWMIDIVILLFFKYYDFFAPEFARLVDILGLHPDPTTLEFLLPIGISFYALKSMSYTMDVYRGRQVPSSNILEYAIYLAFFPALLAGPIDRAKKLLEQIRQPRRITPEKAAAGFSLIVWGYYKKLVIADNLAIFTNQVFGSGVNAAGLDILLGILAYTIQIYADFSGYTDLARGFAYLMGFDLTINFRLPYFALNPADFWQRWHVSLSEWLRDYVFYPVRRLVLEWKISGKEVFSAVLPPLATMLVSGLWHGTGWTFIFWGLYHGVLMIVYREAANVKLPKTLIEFGRSPVGIFSRMTLMFSLISLGWLFFRAGSIGEAFIMLSRISTTMSSQSEQFIKDLVFYSFPLLAVQLWQARKSDLLVLTKPRLAWQVIIHSVILIWIIVFGAQEVTEFIYSQF